MRQLLCGCGIFQACSGGILFVAILYLHVQGAEGVSYFIKVFRETGGVAVVSEDFSLPFVCTLWRASTNLSDIRLITVGTD